MEILPILPADGPIIIAGPCSAESREQVVDTARALAATGKVTAFRAGVWKPRTRPGCFEGKGAEALEWLREAKEISGLPVATEVATPQHVEEALKAGVDILWLGARTTANPFAVQAIADSLAGTSTSILVKNPLSPDIDLWSGAIERLSRAGLKHLCAVHRGFSTYGGASPYRNAPLWTLALQLSVRYPELPILHDPSHVGGRRDLIEPLSRQALDMGFNGLIIESHCNPDSALSDAAQQVTPAELGRILGNLTRRHRDPAEPPRLEELRSRIDALDAELLEVLARRMEVSRQIGEYKRDRSLSVLQASRFNGIVADRQRAAGKMGMSPDFVEALFNAIHNESVNTQLRVLDGGHDGKTNP